MSADTPKYFSIRRLYSGAPYPYITQLKVRNKSASVVTLTVNGDQRVAEAEDVLTFGADQLGRIYYYTVEADGAVTAGELVLLENGGITQPWFPP